MRPTDTIKAAIAVPLLLLASYSTSLAQTSKCGPEPLASACHKPPTCTADGWQPGPPLPLGSSCRTVLKQLGQCNATGVCIKTVTGSALPAYYVVTILYAPPGNKSKASYFAGSSAGTTTNVANLFGIGTKVGLTGNVIATTDYKFTQQTAQSFQITKTTKTELDTNSVTDTIRHGQDLIYLWLNPVINYSQAQSPGMPINISLATAGGADMKVIPYSVDALLHQGAKLPGLENFSKSDLTQIVSVDPWVSSPEGQPDPKRFIKIMSLQLDGPDEQGGNLSGEGVSVDDSQVGCITNTISQTIGSDFGGAVGVSFFGQGEKATIVDSLFWTNTNSAGNCNGSSQTAVVDLSTTTVGFHDVIDVYEDSIYHSFAYVSETQGVGLPLPSAEVTGVVRDAAGKPVAKQLVTVKFANGSTRKLFSNAHGNYRIFKVPAGVLTITVGGVATKAKFVSGRPIVQDLIAGAKK